MELCKPCQDAGRERKAVLRIDAEPICSRCARGESSSAAPAEPLRPEPRLIRKPPILPLGVLPERQGKNTTQPAAEVLPPKAEIRLSQPQCWDLSKTVSLVPIDQVLSVVEREFSLPAHSLRIRTNQRRIVRPRQLAMLKLYEPDVRSYPVIGRFFEMHHTTVMHSIHTARKRIADDYVFAAHSKRIDEALRACLQTERDSTLSWFQRQARRDSDLIREMKNVASLVRGFAPMSELPCGAEQAGVA